jgi:hypothetical protein
MPLRLSVCGPAATPWSGACLTAKYYRWQQHCVSRAFSVPSRPRRRRLLQGQALRDLSVAAIDVTAAIPWFLNHPIVTLLVALLAVVAIPRIIKVRATGMRCVMACLAS